jgi:hypothetical protein
MASLCVRAAGAPAGTGAAAAAAAEGVGGGDGKTGPVAGVDEIDLDGAAFRKQIFVHQKFQAAFLKDLIVIF